MVHKEAITGAVTITAAAAMVTDEVNVTITLPQGELPLSTDATCETAGIKSVTLYWTDTDNNPVSRNANYYPWCYKAHITIIPMEGYILTDSTNVSINNEGVEEKILDTDGTLKVANPYYSNQGKLSTEPSDEPGTKPSDEPSTKPSDEPGNESNNEPGGDHNGDSSQTGSDEKLVETGDNTLAPLWVSVLAISMTSLFILLVFEGKNSKGQNM